MMSQGREKQVIGQPTRRMGVGQIQGFQQRSRFQTTNQFIAIINRCVGKAQCRQIVPLDLLWLLLDLLMKLLEGEGGNLATMEHIGNSSG